MKQGKYLYAIKDNIFFLKIVGSVRYTMCAGLETFLEKLSSEIYDNILIDLTECTYLDSTNLGLIGKIAVDMHKFKKNKATIISTNSNINEILESVSFDTVFTIIYRPDNFIENYKEINNIDETDREMSLRVLKTHKLLMNLSEKNKETFKSVVEVIQKELNVN